MIENEIDDVINYVLDTIYGQHLMSKVMSEDEVSKLHWGHIVLGQRRLNTQEWGSVVSQMQTMGLIYKQDGYWFLTGLGFDIIRVGGWKEHVRLTKENKKLHRNNLDAATKTNNSVRINMWITLAVAAISAIATVGQWRISARQDKVKYQRTAKQPPNRHCTHCSRHDRVLNHEKTDTKHEKQTLTPSP